MHGKAGANFRADIHRRRERRDKVKNGNSGSISNGDTRNGWGLIAPSGAGLIVVKEASKKDRAAIDEEIGRAVKKQVDELVALKVKNQIGNLKRENEELNRIIRTFSEVSGIQLRDFNVAEIAEAVKFVRNNRVIGISKCVTTVRENLEVLLKRAREIENQINRVE